MERCTKCVLPDTIPDIQFDSDGSCNYCSNHQSVQVKGDLELQKILDAYRVPNKKYDCMVGISGGRDSAFTLYKVVKDFGMRALAVNYANPFTSQQAKDNMKSMTDILNVDFISFERY